MSGSISVVKIVYSEIGEPVLHFLLSVICKIEILIMKFKKNKQLLLSKVRIDTIKVTFH